MYWWIDNWDEKKKLKLFTFCDGNWIVMLKKMWDEFFFDKNSNCDKTEKLKNSNCDQNPKLKLWQNPQIKTLLKLRNWNYDKYQKHKLWQKKFYNSKTQMWKNQKVTKQKKYNCNTTQKLKMLQNTKSQIVT